MKIFRIALGLALAAIMIGGQAWANPVDVTFYGNLETPYAQQYKTFTNLKAANGNLPEIFNSTTAIKTVRFTSFNLCDALFAGENHDSDKTKVGGIWMDQSFGGIGMLTKINQGPTNSVLERLMNIGDIENLKGSPFKYSHIKPHFSPNSADASFITRSRITEAAPVPEPGTLSMLGLGLAGLVFSRRSVKRSGTALLKRCSFVSKCLGA